MKRPTVCRFAATLAVLLAATEVFSRPDYYTTGFYTRGSDSALYMDQGGVPDPFYVPLDNWSLLPRITLEATREDNYFLDEDQTAATTVNVIPGAMLIYGRPEHNHVYSDFGVVLPVYQSDEAVRSDPSYMVTAGGVYKTGRSQVHGRVGHRRTESSNTLVGERIVADDYTADLAVERRVSTKTSLGVNGTFEDHAYDHDSYVDYQRYYAAGRAYHQLTEKSEWFTQAGVGFDDQERERLGVHGDATFFDLSAGVRGKPAPKSAAYGRLGYRWREYDDETIDGVEGIVANVGAETSPFGLSTFSVELLSDLRPDITGAGDSTLDRRVVFGVKRRLFSERLRGDASLLFGEAEYNGPDGSTQDDYWGYRVALDWWTRWEASVGLAYTYTERESAERADYESGLWTLRMSWNY
jgi:hypothetical protein